MTAVLHLLRLTIEAVTPLSVGSGDLIEESDVALARDASGLPIVAGSSLQGVLRHMWRGAFAQDPSVLFGCDGRGDDDRAGRISFSFGLTHDCHDQAACGLRTPAEIARDPVLAMLAKVTPVLRHHVKLNHRSVADDTCKFDRSAVPAGTRFSFELAMWGTERDHDDDTRMLARLVGLIGHPAFRLGGAARRGYGRLRIVRHSHLCLSAPAVIRQRRGELHSTPLAGALVPEVPASAVVTATVTLHPVGPWRIGWRTEGTAEGRSHSMTLGTDGLRRKGRHAPQLGDLRSEPQAKEVYAMREPRILWDANGGQVDLPAADDFDRFAVPGSGFRGALAHRALFHWNAGHDRTIDPDHPPSAESLAEWARPPAEFDGLFGTAKERKDRDRGQASALYVADGAATGVRAVQAIPHSSVDRFTGGVRSGVLYVEEVAIAGTIVLDVMVVPSPERDMDPAVRSAFLKALRDLTSGRLAFGAKSHGFASGHVVWSDPDSAWAKDWEGLR